MRRMTRWECTRRRRRFRRLRTCSERCTSRTNTRPHNRRRLCHSSSRCTQPTAPTVGKRTSQLDRTPLARTACRRLRSAPSATACSRTSRCTVSGCPRSHRRLLRRQLPRHRRTRWLRPSPRHRCLRSRRSRRLPRSRRSPLHCCHRSRRRRHRRTPRRAARPLPAGRSNTPRPPATPRPGLAPSSFEVASVRDARQWSAARRTRADLPPSPRRQKIIPAGMPRLRMLEACQRASLFAGRLGHR